MSFENPLPDPAATAVDYGDIGTLRPPPPDAELSQLARQRPDAPLGTLIYRAGLVAAKELEEALEEGVKTGRRLGEILVARGLLQETDLARVLAGQKGLRYVGLEGHEVDPAATALLSEHQARTFRALPIGFEDGLPLVAMADPENEAVRRELVALFGGGAHFLLAANDELANAIQRAYASAPPQAPAPLAPVPPAPALLRLEPEPAPEPLPPAASATVFHVSLRLTNGDQVELAVCDGEESAKERAWAFIEEIRRDGALWPLVEGRFIRPGAIVSVDLVEH